MPLDFIVRRVIPEDWSALRDLRLESLRTDPLAFGSTLDRELGFPSERWQERAKDGAISPRSATFVAVAPDGRLAGMAGTMLTDVPRVLAVWGMWVRPEARGKGLGGKLLDALLAWGRCTHPGSTVRLEVNPEQVAAVHLYESRGFSPTGRERPLGHHAPALCREMELLPPAPDG